MSLIKGVHHIALKCCGISEFEKTIETIAENIRKLKQRFC